MIQVMRIGKIEIFPFDNGRGKIRIVLRWGFPTGKVGGNVPSVIILFESGKPPHLIKRRRQNRLFFRLKIHFFENSTLKSGCRWK